MTDAELEAFADKIRDAIHDRPVEVMQLLLILAYRRCDPRCEIPGCFHCDCSKLFEDMMVAIGDPLELTHPWN